MKDVCRFGEMLAKVMFNLRDFQLFFQSVVIIDFLPKIFNSLKMCHSLTRGVKMGPISVALPQYLVSTG